MANDELVQSLARLGETLKGFRPDDRDALVQIGVALEQASADIPADMPHACALLEVAVDGLQALYSHLAANPEGLVLVLADAVAHARQLLAEDGDVDGEQALAEVRAASEKALHEEPDEPPAPEEAQAPEVEEAPPVTLHDVSALLIQIEPGDRKELEDLRKALAAIGADDSLPPAVRECVQQVAAKVDGLMEGTAENPDDELEEIGRLLEAAGKGAAAEAPPAPVDEPKPAAPPEDDVAAEAPVRISLPDDTDVELVGEFIIESRENIEQAEAALLTLETDPSDQEAVNVVFRAFHTIKGTSAFLDLDAVTGLAHLAESLMSRVRDGEIQLAGGYADLSLRSVDMLAELMQSVEDALGGEPMDAPPALADLMAALEDPDQSCAEADPLVVEDVEVRVGDILGGADVADLEDVEDVAAQQGDRPIGEVPVRSDAAPTSDVATAPRAQRTPAQGGAAASLRVRTDRLDKLIETVGELVIAHSMVAQDESMTRQHDPELSRKVARTGKIVRELQDLSMSMRMVPLKPTFGKLARLVRDLAHKNGKIVEFVTEGEDTEIDRNMVDVINDPLVHMIRNAVDHGIEPPDVREQAGKSKGGVVGLSACHSGGSVVVELRDDGKGLDREMIVEKAIAKGLIRSDKGMSNSEVFNLIFEPGFSTADKVTEVSGRGVGMDVVKRSVEALRGRVDISSELGKGTTFSVRLPLTLAITDGMLVSVGEERYIIPIFNIEMTFRPEPDALSSVAGRGEMVMLHDQLMPVLRLHRLFRVDGAIEELTEGMLIVLDDGDRRYALLADELLGQQQVVAKSLGDGIGQIEGISGAAVLGDGRVGLILDPIGLAAVASQGTHAPIDEFAGVLESVGAEV